MIWIIKIILTDDKHLLVNRKYLYIFLFKIFWYFKYNYCSWKNKFNILHYVYCSCPMETFCKTSNQKATPLECSFEQISFFQFTRRVDVSYNKWYILNMLYTFLKCFFKHAMCNKANSIFAFTSSLLLFILNNTRIM